MKRIICAHLSLFAVLLAPIAANADIIKLKATIDGAQANAGMGTGSASAAFANMSYDDMTMTLSWMISEVTPFFNSAVRFAHFHGPATPTMNAGVQVWICDNLNVFPSAPTCGGAGTPFATGSALLSADQAQDLLAGSWYINIHTDAFPPGEIRGQVTRVPEPGSLALLGLGLLGMGWARRRKT